MKSIESDANLLIIEAVEGFAYNHHISSSEVLDIFTEKALSHLEFLGRDEYDAEIFI